MTKQQEIAWLDHAIATLGPHTYLGASLGDQREAIIGNIRNDVPALELQYLYSNSTLHTALIQRNGKRLHVFRLPPTLPIRESHSLSLTLPYATLSPEHPREDKRNKNRTFLFSVACWYSGIASE